MGWTERVHPVFILFHVRFGILIGFIPSVHLSVDNCLYRWRILLQQNTSWSICCWKDIALMSLQANLHGASSSPWEPPPSLSLWTQSSWQTWQVMTLFSQQKKFAQLEYHFIYKSLMVSSLFDITVTQLRPSPWFVGLFSAEGKPRRLDPEVTERAFWWNLQGLQVTTSKIDHILTQISESGFKNCPPVWQPWGHWLSNRLWWHHSCPEQLQEPDH